MNKTPTPDLPFTFYDLKQAIDALERQGCEDHYPIILAFDNDMLDAISSITYEQHQVVVR